MAYSIVHPFFDPCSEGFNEMAAQYGIEVFIDAPQTGNVADQIKILEDFLSKGVDALAICPTEPKSVEPIIAQRKPYTYRSSASRTNPNQKNTGNSYKSERNIVDAQGQAKTTEAVQMRTPQKLRKPS